MDLKNQKKLSGGFLRANNLSLTTSSKIIFSEKEKEIINSSQISKNIKLPKNKFNRDFVINFFKSEIIRQKFNLSRELVEKIVCDINKNPEAYNVNNISEKLKVIILENLELYDIKLSNLLINLKNKNLERVPSYNNVELTIGLSELINKKENIVKNFFNIKSKIIECMEKNINLINSYYIDQKKKYLESRELIIEYKGEYDSIFKKLIPLYKTTILRNITEIESNFILYLKTSLTLKDKSKRKIYYKLEENINPEISEISYYMIDRNFEITTTNLIESAVDFKIIYHNDILNFDRDTNCKYLKYIYMILKDLDNISKSLQNLYKYYEKNEQVKKYFDYQYLLMGYLSPKKPLVENILNTFIYSGLIDELYDLFGSKSLILDEDEKFVKRLEIYDRPSLTIKITKKDYGEFNNKLFQLITSKLIKLVENRDISELLFLQIINNFEYEDLSEEEINVIKKITNEILILYVNSRKILDNLKISENGVFNIIYSFNFLDLIDSSRRFNEKIEIVDENIENQLNIVNLIINKNVVQTKLILFLNIIKFRKIIIDASKVI